MQIGTIIRKRRLEKNLTQEEVAKRLGVSAPAVNKWEKGRSMPDIALLSPIARLLDITLDALLSHTQALTDKDAERLITIAREKLKSEPFEKVFIWVKELMHTYPNHESLTFALACLLHSHLQMKEADITKDMESFFVGCYQRAVTSGDAITRAAAADALYYHYMGLEQWDKAEQTLVYMNTENPEHKRKLAAVYREKGCRDEALRMAEELLYSGYHRIHTTLNDIYLIAMAENDFDKAHYIANKQEQLARLFEMGEYHEVSPELELAMLEKDTERYTQIIHRLMENTQSIFGFIRSPLYAHMKFNTPESQAEYTDEVRQSLLKCLELDSQND